MIAHLSGIVRAIALDRVVVEVGGVGLSVLVSPQTTSQLNVGAPVQLFTSLDRKSTRLNSSHSQQSRMPSSA